MTVFEEVAEKVVVEYKKNLTKKLQMVDAFIAFTVATGVVQVLLTSYNLQYHKPSKSKHAFF